MSDVHSFHAVFLTAITFAQHVVMNDMCATCWFAYLLLFLEKNVELTNPEAGVVMMCGQVCVAFLFSSYYAVYHHTDLTMYCDVFMTAVGGWYRHPIGWNLQ